MAGLKSLAKETAIYGLSSIVGRFLNYLLVPVYTMAMSAQSGGYGVVTNVYALGGPHAGIIDVRHGNRFLPLCQ